MQISATPPLPQAPVAVAPPALTDALHDRFTVERELGRGGMGLVFLARDLRYNRKVALTVIRPEVASVAARRWTGRPKSQLAGRMSRVELHRLVATGRLKAVRHAR